MACSIVDNIKRAIEQSAKEFVTKAKQGQLEQKQIDEGLEKLEKILANYAELNKLQAERKLEPTAEILWSVNGIRNDIAEATMSEQAPMIEEVPTEMELPMEEQLPMEMDFPMDVEYEMDTELPMDVEYEMTEFEGYEDISYEDIQAGWMRAKKPEFKLKEPIKEIEVMKDIVAELVNLERMMETTKDKEVRNSLTGLMDDLKAKIVDSNEMVKRLQKSSLVENWTKELLKADGSRLHGLAMVDMNKLAESYKEMKEIVNLATGSINAVQMLPKKDGEDGSRFKLTKNGAIHKTLVNDNPAIQILLKMKDGDAVVDETVAVALQTAVMDYVQGRMVEGKEESLDDLAKAFGLETLEKYAAVHNAAEVDMYAEQLQQLMDAKSVTTAAHDIGRNVMSMLGINFDKSMPIVDQYRMYTSMGSIGLNMLIEQGYIKDYRNAGDARVNFGTNGDIKLVKLTEKAKKKSNQMKMVDMLKVVETIVDDEVKMRKSFRTKELMPVRGRAEIHHGHGLTTATQAQTDAMNVMRGLKHNVFVDALMVLDEYDVTDSELKEMLGWQDENKVKKRDDISKTTKEGIIARNRNAEDFMDALQLLREHANDSLYYDWFVTVAGRFNQNATVANRQGDKEISRWVVTSEEDIGTAKLSEDDGQEMRGVYWTIAQAFKVDTDKMGVDDVVEKGRELVAMGVDGLVEKFKKKEYAHPGQAMAAIATVKEIERAKAEGRDEVTVSLLAELDGKTNGFAVRLMQFPLEGYEKNLARVGIVLEGSEYYGVNNQGELFGKDGIADIYMLEGDTMGKIIEHKMKTNEISREAQKAMEVELLPNVLKEKDSTMQKMLRTLAKPATMVFNYSAGRESIIRNTTMEMVETYVDKLFTAEGRKFISDWIEERYQGQPNNKQKIDEVLNNLRTVRVDLSTNEFVREYREMVRSTYAEPMYEALEETLGDYIEFNKAVNNGYKLMYEVAARKLGDVLRVNKNVESITQETLEKALHDIKDFIPGVMGRDSKDVSDKLIILAREMVNIPALADTLKMGYSESKRIVGNSVIGGEGEKDTISVLVKWFGEPGNSGSVLPTHNQEGSIMAEVVKKHKVLGIHDAVAVGATKIDEVGKSLNETFYRANMEFSMMDALMEQVERAVQAGKVYKIAIGKKTAEDVLETLQEYADVIATNRENMRSKNMKVMQFGGMEGSVYEANIKEINAKISEDKKEVVSDLKEMIEEMSNSKLKTKLLNVLAKLNEEECL